MEQICGVHRRNSQSRNVNRDESLEVDASHYYCTQLVDVKVEVEDEKFEPRRIDGGPPGGDRR